MASTKRKIINFILITIGGLIFGIVISFYLSLRMSVPPTDGDLPITGITTDVTISYDSLGIPQIWASTETDAYFTLGFQHAADRLFQMDLTRRLASGRLSEMFGDISREVDIENRAIGHYRLASEAVKKLNESDKEKLQAYVNGINQYVINTRALPFEYRFLPVEFMAWTMEDCLTILSFQCWYSNGLMNRERFYTNLATKVGPAKAASLRFAYPDWAPTTVPSTIQQSSITPPPHSLRYSTTETENEEKETYSIREQIYHALFENNQRPYLMTEASNAWVIGPEKSTSGFPLLASDPHLEITRLPQFWHAVGIHATESDLNVMGITTPGLPFVVMGFNSKAGWAFTAGGNDLTDYLTVSTDPENSKRFFADSAWHEFDIITDSFYIMGSDTIEPVLHYSYGNAVVIERDSSNQSATLLHWAGFDRSLSDAVTNGFALHQVASFNDFRHQVTNFGALDANYLYADFNGTIGYQLTSPIKTMEEDEVIPSEFESFTKQKNYRPIDQTPHTQNPQQGWIASSNNKPNDDPTITGHYFATRILSISEILKKKSSFTIEDMKSYQMSTDDKYLLKIISLLKEHVYDLPVSISGFDGTATSNDSTIVLVTSFFEFLKRYTFQDELDDLYLNVPDKWLEQLPQVVSAGWFDDITTPDVEETISDIAAKAIEEATFLSEGKSWGDVLTLQMKHPLSLIPVINSFLNLTGPEDRWHGTSGTLNATFFSGSPENGYQAIAGPSMRLLIDIADPNEASIVLPAGNSGNPMSDHFFDFYEMWKSGERWPISLDSAKTFTQAKSVLTLQPR